MKIKQEYRLRIIGQTLNGYQVQEKIWQGATSTVFRGQSMNGAPYGEVVAVKVLHPYRMLDAQRKQFVVEARMMMRLLHPNIVKVYGVYNWHNTLYMLMEFVNGKSLRQHLSEREVEPDRLISVFLETGKGIAYVHNSGIVHKDVKPENILVSGTFDAVKLTDFGYADYLNRMWWQRRAALNGGTEKYMAPEHKTGKSDQRTDIYSFGIMMEELLLPKVDETAKDILKGIINKATSPMPDRRYQTISHLLLDFEPLAQAYLGSPE